MPSRKKTQGQARKAKEKAPKVPPKEEQHPRAAESCSHGAPSNVPPACRDFTDDFVRICEKEEMLTTRKILEVTEEMLLKHQQVALDASLIGIVRSVYVSNGVSWALKEDFMRAALFSIAALSLDVFSDFSSPATQIKAEFKVRDLIGNECDDRAVVKWLSKSVPCSCLKHTLRDLRKAQEKSKKCWGCGKLVEISKLMACDGCKMALYCSEDCQKADWHSRHKDCCLQLSEDKKLLDQHRGL